MIARSTSCILLVLCVVPLVFAGESIKITLPRTLAALYPDGVTERPAMFGVPSYATTLTGRLIWSAPGDRDGCAPVNKSALDWPKAPGVSVILLMDRGACTFVTKVRNAEQVGAIAAIIVDNVDEPGLPFMADDGTGRNIAIPSALIHKNDGAVIKQYLVNGSVVQVQMSWSLPRPDNRVEYDLWTSSVDEQSRTFKQVFATAVTALGEHAKFTPRYWILNGADYGCTEAGEPCGSQCLPGGKYCAVDPEHDLSVGLDGKDVVMENLAQLCLYEYLNASNQDYKWWTYASCFNENCYPTPPAQSDWTPSCKQTCLQNIGVSPSIIATCIAASQSAPDGTNPKLANEITWRNTLGVFFMPTLLVNLTPYRGSLVCPEPLDTIHCGPLAMICQGYLAGTEPDACSSSPGCPPGVYRDGCSVCGGRNESCADCAGKPYGSAVRDSKGGCCMATEMDCLGICRGSGKIDICGICGGTDGDACNVCRTNVDPAYMPPNMGGLDVCGNCLRFSNPSFNNSGCIGCDGIPKSGKSRDVCGVCGGTTTDPSKCPNAASSIGVGGIVGISLGCVAFAGLVVFFYMKRQQQQLKNVLKHDIDSLLKQYLPLDAANSLAHPATAAGDTLVPDSARSSEL